LYKKRGWFYKFRIDERRSKFRKKSKFLLKKLNLLRMRLFYGIFNHKKYIRLLKNRSHADNYQTFLYTLMERRLDVILYRGCFCSSIYIAQQMVRHGFVLVNGVVIRNFYRSIKFYQKVTFASNSIRDRMQYNYLIQLRLKKLKFFIPKYMVVNFLFMYLFIRPIISFRKEIGLPFKLKSRYLTYK